MQTMNAEIRMHDLVALIEDTSARHFQTGAPLLLHRGQIGTVVTAYDGTAFEIEFPGADGRAYAILQIPSAKLMQLHNSPLSAAA